MWEHPSYANTPLVGQLWGGRLACPACYRYRAGKMPTPQENNTSAKVGCTQLCEVIAMEAFALGFILAQGLADVIGKTILPEVVGGRADAAVCTGFKAFISYLKQENGKLANHDLQKALRRSFLSALQDIASERKQELSAASITNQRESFAYPPVQRQSNLR